MTSFGPVHKLIVREVGDDDEFHVAEFEDYEVVHPSGCTAEDGYWHCGVGHNMDNVGLRFSLRYTGTPVTTPGEYPIRAWAETYRGFEYTEYDGGIGIVDVTDEAVE